MSRRAAATALAAYVAFLAAVTLGASPGAVFAESAAAVRGVGALEWITSRDVERAANVLLFVPAGLLLCYVLPRTSRRLVWLICVAVSVGVEAAQFPLAERDATPVDVVTNATGAALGVAGHALLTWLFAARPGRRSRPSAPPTAR